MGDKVPTTFKGISSTTDGKSWRTEVTSNGQRYVLGSYTTQEAAVSARDKVLYKLGRLSRIQLPLTSDTKRELDALTLDQLLATFVPSTSSSYRGVNKRGDSQLWRARFTHNGRKTDLGAYEDEEKAARAYDRKAFAVLGTKAKLNFPNEDHSTDSPAEEEEEKENRLPGIGSLDDASLKPERENKGHMGPKAFTGVLTTTEGRTWKAQVSIKDKTHQLGVHPTKEAAVSARDKVLYKLGRLSGIQLPLTSDTKRELDDMTLEQLMATFVSSTSSSYRGVMRQKKGKPWVARFTHNGRRIIVGAYEDEEEAARAYDRKAFAVLGTKAKLNFPDEDHSTDSPAEEEEEKENRLPGIGSLDDASLKPERENKDYMGSSAFKGIWSRSEGRTWATQVTIDQQAHRLGTYPTQEAAVSARDRVLYKVGRLSDIQLPLTSETKQELDTMTIDELLATFARSFTSIYRGVSRPQGITNWRAAIKVDGCLIHLGMFKDEEDAARAYDRSAFPLWGMDAQLNFPEEYINKDPAKFPLPQAGRKHIRKSQTGQTEAGDMEAYEVSHNWEVEPLHFLLWRTIGKPKASVKIAAFSLDQAIIVKEDHSPDESDNPNNWKYFNGNVPAVIQRYHRNGYNVMVFSNQHAIGTDLEGEAANWIALRARIALTRLETPLQVILATHDNEQQKPSTGMWQFFLKNCNGLVAPDRTKCFFVGGEGGRPGDLGTSDELFAKQIGITYMTPEDCFGFFGGLLHNVPDPSAGK